MTLRSPRAFFVGSFALAWALGAGCSSNLSESASAVGDFGGGFAGGESAALTPAAMTAVGAGPSPQMGTWMNRYGDSADQKATSLAVDGAGDIAITGNAKGTIDFGNIPWSGGAKDTDVFVAKLASSGASAWSRRYGDSCDQHGGGLALSTSGSVLLTGDFCGKMDFGTSSLEAAAGDVDAFAVLLDDLGEDVYSRRIGGIGPQIARGAALSKSGNALLVGSFAQALDAGTGAVASSGMDDVFVIELDPTGAVLWSRTFGGAGVDIATSVAVDAKGDVIVGGTFGGSVDFGGGPLDPGAGKTGAFVLALDPTGKHLWSRSFGEPDTAAVTALAVAANGGIAATGYFTGSIDLGAGVVASVDAEDGFVVRLDPDGSLAVGRPIAGGGSQRGTAVAFAPQGDLVVGGVSDAVFDLAPALPHEQLCLGGSGRMFYVSVDASGDVTAGRTLASCDPPESVGVGVDATSTVVMAGSFQATLSAELGAINSAGGWDVVVTRNP